MLQHYSGQARSQVTSKVCPCPLADRSMQYMVVRTKDWRTDFYCTLFNNPRRRCRLLARLGTVNPGVFAHCRTRRSAQQGSHRRVLQHVHTPLTACCFVFGGVAVGCTRSLGPGTHAENVPDTGTAADM